MGCRREGKAIFGAEQEWSDQLAINLMIWVVFLGIAIGFRERSHTAVEVLVEKLPDRAQQWLQRFIEVLALAFGVFLIVRGLQLTFETGEWGLYAVLPLSGFMTCVYVVLQLFGVRTERSQRDSEEASSA